jgi:deoxyribonuclease V
MRDIPKNLWPGDIQSARLLQNALAKNVSIQPLKRGPKLIGGVDACYTGKHVVAAASLFTYPGLMHLDDSAAREKIRFPYVPGFLSFREGPAIITALRRLKTPPDLVLFDGQGIAHPRGMGIASHIGVVLDIPTIGCAKSRLVGEFEEPGPCQGDWSALYFHGRIIGAVLRTRDRVRPVFVSPGHRIDLKASIDIVMRAVSLYRLPEPLRRADHLSRQAAKEETAHER